MIYFYWIKGSKVRSGGKKVDIVTKKVAKRFGRLKEMA
jgi:hypothetical protein